MNGLFDRWLHQFERQFQERPKSIIVSLDLFRRLVSELGDMEIDEVQNASYDYKGVLIYWN